MTLANTLQPGVIYARTSAVPPCCADGLRPRELSAPVWRLRRRPFHLRLSAKSAGLGVHLLVDKFHSSLRTLVSQNPTTCLVGNGRRAPVHKFRS